MAYSGNQQLPGLNPISNGVAGTAPRIREYAVSATYSATIGEGNILIKHALGVNLATGTIAAGRTVVGVAAQNVAGTPGASTVCHVYDDSDQEFACVCDGTVTDAVKIESIGWYVQCLSNVYNATLGQGKTIVDISTATATRTTTRPYQIVGWMENVGETRSSTYAQVILSLGPATQIFESESITGIS